MHVIARAYLLLWVLTYVVEMYIGIIWAFKSEFRQKLLPDIFLAHSSTFRC